jgi:hypothetical protein
MTDEWQQKSFEIIKTKTLNKQILEQARVLFEILSIVRYKVSIQVGPLERASHNHWPSECWCTQEPQTFI